MDMMALRVRDGRRLLAVDAAFKHDDGVSSPMRRLVEAALTMMAALGDGVLARRDVLAEIGSDRFDLPGCRWLGLICGCTSIGPTSQLVL